MPIIQAPAHELDKLNTVVQRFIHVSSSFGQQYVVLTVDQALYCKLMELKWASPLYKNILIPRLGGLHTSMNFLKVIGQHMQASGLSEVWLESGILGPVSTEKALEGKYYTKGMHAHKLTYQDSGKFSSHSYLLTLMKQMQVLVMKSGPSMVMN